MLSLLDNGLFEMREVKICKNHLPIVERFYTIQGEGFNTGKAAYFIRLAGCDVHCTWCDSKNTWDASLHPSISIDEILSDIEKVSAENVVITGGEPLMHDLTDLCSALRDQDLNIFIETSGTHPLSGQFDWICLSPKKQCPPLPEVLEAADEIKVVISTEDDFQWAEENRRKVSKKCLLYLQPDWNRKGIITEQIVEYVKSHPAWRVSLQTHKFMNIP